MVSKVEPFEKKVAWSDEQAEGEGKIGSLWSDFAQNTGFHGVNKLTVGRNYRFRCVWWTIAVLAMSAYMLYNVVNEAMNYYKYPTVTNSKIEIVEEMPFPAVTICNQSPFNLSKIRKVDPALEYFFKKTSFMGVFTGPINWSNPIFGPNFYETRSIDWWSSIAMDPLDVVLLCFMKGTATSPCASKLKTRWTEKGLCATYNGNTSDVDIVQIPGSDNNLAFIGNVYQSEYVHGPEMSAGLKILVHDPSVHPDAASSSFVVSPGMSSNVVIIRRKFKYLPPPYKAFTNSSCLDTDAPTFNNSLQFFSTYTYEQCQLECVIKQAYNICGCVPANYADKLSPVCSIHEMATCYYYKHVFFSTDPTFMRSCGCQMPCSFITYETKVSSSRYPSSVAVSFIIELGLAPNESAIRSNYLEVKLFYERMMVYSTEQMPKYSSQSIIGNLGGQMGICLGASILTLTELGEFLVILCLTCFKRLSSLSEVKKPIK